MWSGGWGPNAVQDALVKLTIMVFMSALPHRSGNQPVVQLTMFLDRDHRSSAMSAGPPGGQESGGWQLSITVLESSPHFAAGPINEIDVLWSSVCADAWSPHADAWSPHTSAVGPVGWLPGQLPLPTVV